MIIKRIHIKNFRSIVNQIIDLSRLNVFVGNNDHGKSNVLRALELFFRDSKEVRNPFIFEHEFCVFAKVPEKKAKEISIELVFDSPTNYSVEGEIHWLKTWRREGVELDEISLQDRKPFPPRSRARALLKNIRYYYVPAIKGPEYFQELFGTLHDMLSETVAGRMRQASKDFTSAIKENTSEILNDIKLQLGFDASIELPTNLRELFQTLDFQEESDANKLVLSLRQRGDGIKVRHIPILLKWFSQQVNRNLGPGAIPSNSIWGYEEPENNLELTSAQTLASQFTEYATYNQILITTHSPAFYKLWKADAKIFSVAKNKEGETAIQDMGREHEAELDTRLGLLSIMSSYLEKAQEERTRLDNEIKRLKLGSRPTIFVEGRSDEFYLGTAINIYRPKLLERVIISGPPEDDSEGGVRWVADMLIGLSHLRRLAPAIGVFDEDSAGREYRAKVTEHQTVKESKGRIKCIFIQPSPPVAAIKSKGIVFPFSIEDLFTLDVRKHAAEHGWLEDRTQKELSNFSPVSDIRKSFADQCEAKGLSEDDCLYVMQKIKSEKKRAFRAYIQQQIADQGRGFFSGFLPTIEKLEVWANSISN